MIASKLAPGSPRRHDHSRSASPQLSLQTPPDFASGYASVPSPLSPFSWRFLPNRYLSVFLTPFLDRTRTHNNLRCTCSEVYEGATNFAHLRIRWDNWRSGSSPGADTCGPTDAQEEMATCPEWGRRIHKNRPVCLCDRPESNERHKRRRSCWSWRWMAAAWPK